MPDERRRGLRVARSALPGHRLRGAGVQTDIRGLDVGAHTRTDGASLDTTVTYPSTPQGTEANIAKVKVSLPARAAGAADDAAEGVPGTDVRGEPCGLPRRLQGGRGDGEYAGAAHSAGRAGVLRLPRRRQVPRTGDRAQRRQRHDRPARRNGDLKKGVLTSTFNAVPDAPFSSFELNLPEGPYSALTANGANLCKAGTLTMPTELVAQDGAVIDQSTKLKVTGCPKKKRIRHKASKKGGKHRK